MSAEDKSLFVQSVIFTWGVLSSFCCYKWGWHRGAARAYGDIAKRLREWESQGFSIAPDGKSITCHVCGMTSHNPNDVRYKYCGMCHVFHEK